MSAATSVARATQKVETPGILRADVSEFAKRFYQKYLSTMTAYGGWSDEEYLAIQELDKAGLIKTGLVYVDYTDIED